MHICISVIISISIITGTINYYNYYYYCNLLELVLLLSLLLLLVVVAVVFLVASAGPAVAEALRLRRAGVGARGAGGCPPEHLNWFSLFVCFG